jgi:hypothetical protein
MKNRKSLKTHTNKRKVLTALEECLGIVTTACESASVARRTFYQWMTSDPLFKAEVVDITNRALDFVESKLFENIDSNDTTSIIFYLKTKGKDRGYTERQEIEHSTAPGKRITLVVKPNEDI